MSWASRRRFVYGFGVFLFLMSVVGVPLFLYTYKPASCFDGIQNQGETAPDRSGPCALLDERRLIPYSLQWARGFAVRDGSWSAVAYIENPNPEAGVRAVPYRFKLYDDRNIIVAEREGITYVMPESVTPVYEGAIDTGNRNVARTFFEFGAPLVWERLVHVGRPVTVNGKKVSDVDTMPRVTAIAENTDVFPLRDVEFVATVFDPAGNAIASSRTIIEIMRPGEKIPLTFTWPDPFEYPTGRIDVLPRLEPEIPRR